MNQSSVTVNRALVGIISLVLLGIWAVLTFVISDHEMWAGACLKVGLVMGSLWLALPAITKNPVLMQASWATVLGGLLIAVVIARTKVSLNVLIPMISAFVVLTRFLAPRRPRPDR